MPQTSNVVLHDEDKAIVAKAAERFGTVNPDGTPNVSATARAVLRDWEMKKDLPLNLARMIQSWPEAKTDCKTTARPRRARRSPAAAVSA